MGDSVNLASRLEGANKNYGTYMMVGENTYAKAKEACYFRQLDVIRVKGKTEPVKVYELMGRKDVPLPEARLQLIESYTKGLENYFLQHWDQALEFFDQVLKIDPKDTVAKLYLKRCKEFRQNSPGKDWDGVFTLTEK
jgi:adenylate cyclase